MQALLDEAEKELTEIPRLCVLLMVNSRTGDFSITPTTLVLGLPEKGDGVTWISNQGPFVIQFRGGTPFKVAQFHSEEIKPSSLYMKKVLFPRKLKAGIFEYAVGLCTDGKAFVHVSGELSMNPGGNT